MFYNCTESDSGKGGVWKQRNVGSQICLGSQRAGKCFLPNCKVWVQRAGCGKAFLWVGASHLPRYGKQKSNRYFDALQGNISSLFWEKYFSALPFQAAPFVQFTQMELKYKCIPLLCTFFLIFFVVFKCCKLFLYSKGTRAQLSVFLIAETLVFSSP